MGPWKRITSVFSDMCWGNSTATVQNVKSRNQVIKVFTGMKRMQQEK